MRLSRFVNRFSLTRCFALSAAALVQIPMVSAQPLERVIEEVVVTGTLMSSDAGRLSSTTIDASDVRSRGAAHFEDVLTAIPNVSASAGASRQRFFQIRGIGERSQFIEPINPSVVILQDGVDISGLGAALTTFDTTRIDVLRGPQGSIMGAGALAGLIAAQTQTPVKQTKASLAFGLESHGGERVEVVGNSALTDTLSVRAAHQTYQSDGWIDNTYLGVSDTSNRDESTTRISMRHSYVRDTIDVGVTRLSINNGYDAFSLDNTRETLSDEPGEDSLDFLSAFMRWRHEGAAHTSSLQISRVDAEAIYSYDEDWSFVGIRPFWEYSSFDAYDRTVKRNTIEWRLSPSEPDTTDWIVGLYSREEEESLQRDYTYLDTPFDSANHADTAAVFGQVTTALDDTLTLTVGARAERREVDYRDSASVSERFSAQYWTGHVSLEKQLNPESTAYVTVSRGVRAGGVNAALSSTLLALTDEVAVDPYTDQTRFDEEALLNYELGLRYAAADGRLSTALALFSMHRDDQQVKGSLVIPRTDGSTSFTDFTDNAATGTNRGLELSMIWQASQAFQVAASFGHLVAQFDDYTNVDGLDLAGRDQPHAPSWQYRINIAWQISQALSASLEGTGRDSFYLSDRHSVQSPEADLLNANITWNRAAWSVSLWGRNLTDELTVTRGFGTFGNDPRKDYALEPYYQFGEPRTLGATVSYQFGG